MGFNLSELVRKKTVIDINGANMKFTELTLADMAEFRAWVQDQRKATRQQRAERLLADAERLKIDPKDVLEMLDQPPTEQEYEEAAESIEGVICLAWLSLKHHHVGITRDEVGQLINVGKTAEIVSAMFPQDEKKSQPTLKQKRSRGVLQSRSSSAGTKAQSNGKTSTK